MDKSPEAFRTISEVAEALETPAHVLRFWESRFPQIRPVKRAGGRRYYRPSDVALLAGIKRLLHEEGLTIRGVQKILREQGIRHVSGLAEETSPEEEALEAAMPGRLDADPEETSPEEAADATAAALAAALDEAPEDETPEDEGLDAWPEPLWNPAQALAREFAAANAAKTAAEAPMPEPAPDPLPEPEPVKDVAAAPEPEPAVATLAEAEPAAATPQQPELALFDADPAPPPAPEPAPPSPGLPPEVFAAARSASESLSPHDDEPTTTLASRLRALPRGSLSAKAEPLAALNARLAEVRARMAAPPAS